MSIPTPPPSTVILDTFNRTVASSSWGTANTGQAYTTLSTGGSTANVDGTGGHLNVAAAPAFAFCAATTVSIADVDLSVSGSVALSGGIPLGGQVEFLGLLWRYTDSTHYFMARIDIQTDGTMNLSVFSHDTSTMIGQRVGVLAGAAYTSGQSLSMRVQAFGMHIRAKVWVSANPEPLNWDVVAVDSSYLVAGAVGVRSGCASGNTNTKSIVSSYTQFWAAPFVAPTRTQALHPVVKAAFGYSVNTDPSTWQYTDITRYVRGQLGFSGGKQSTASSADPAQINISLANTDGRFTARNPLSPYWPNVVRNVPLWVGLTWDGATDTYELLTTFVNGWPLQPNAGVIDVTVPITATGRLRRLRRSSTQLLSALRRALTTYSPVVGYWPLEAGSGQAVIGQDANIFNATWQAPTGIDGSDSLPVWSATATASAAITHTFSNNKWQFDWYMNFPTGPATDTIVFHLSAYSGTASTIIVSVSSTAFKMTATDSTGATVGSINVTPTAVFGSWQHFRVQLQQVSGTCTCKLVWFPVAGGNGFAASTTWSGTAGHLGRWWIPVDSDLNGVTIGHINVLDGYDLGGQDNAARGWSGEAADARVTRLCAESIIPVTVISGRDPAQLMGPQGIAGLATLLDECAEIDNGLLHDAGPSGDLMYVSGTARYNAPAAASADFKAHQIGDGLATTYDDQDLVTQWIVTDSGGSSFTASKLSATSSETTTDAYGQPVTVNAANDGQLPAIAGWRVHLGTYDAYRIPSISVDLRRNPELAVGIVQWGLPSRITPLNLPSPYPPESLDQFVEGFSAVVDSVTWQVTLNCTPFAPWQVGVYGSSKYDSGSSTLASGLSKLAVGATDTLSVATTNAADLWTLDSTQWTAGSNGPLYIKVSDAEVMQVTNITGASSPQTITVVRGVNGITIAHATNAAVHLATPAVVGL